MGCVHTKHAGVRRLPQAKLNRAPVVLLQSRGRPVQVRLGRGFSLNAETGKPIESPSDDKLTRVLAGEFVNGNAGTGRTPHRAWRRCGERRVRRSCGARCVWSRYLETIRTVGALAALDNSRRRDPSARHGALHCFGKDSRDEFGLSVDIRQQLALERHPQYGVLASAWGIRIHRRCQPVDPGACWAWTGGFVLGAVSQKIVQTNRLLFSLLPLLGTVPGAPLYETFYWQYLHRSFGTPSVGVLNAPVFALAFYRQVLPVIVQTILVVIPALWGIRKSAGMTNFRPALRGLIWIAALASD